MNEREQVAWLLRRAGFGAAPGQIDALAARGAGGLLDELLDPDAHGLPPLADPWGSLDFSGLDPTTARRRKIGLAVTSWLAAMATATRPLEEWMRWFWHGHFVSTIREVRSPELMFGQLNMLAARGLGDFGSLLRAVTVDPAMLIYLDGVASAKGNVNENYGRELLELFSLGIGNYTEADVRAGATALTGWKAQEQPTATFVARRHDDTPQDYLGRTGVHDVDTVIDAVTAHDACARFITGKLSAALLGPGVDSGLVDRLADDFRSSGLQIRPLVRAILEAGLDGASRPLILAPVPWLVSTTRYVGAPVAQALQTQDQIVNLVAAGQQPMNAPNVGGWPGGRAWLSSSATVARFNMASVISSLAPADGPALAAVQRRDLRALADALGHPEGYGEATTKALNGIRPEQGGPTAVLTVALASPEGVMA